MTKPRKDPDSLNESEEIFCQEYVVDRNGTRAIQRAGFKGKDSSAAVAASKWLKKDKIVVRIQTLMDERAKRVQVEADDILMELKRLGYSDLRGLFREDGTIKHPTDWPEDLARAVASIEVEELFEGHGENRTWIGYTKKVKFWPKDRALELMGKHKKLFTEKVEHSGTMTLADLVAGSKEDEKK